MAEFNTEGMEELSWAFLRMEENATGTVQEMLEANAEIYIEQQKQAATDYGIKKTGGFINSIKAGKMQQEDTEMYILIKPEGKADHKADYGGGYSTKAGKRKGKSQAGNIRYAAIGYIYEYGTKTMPARPWLTKGNAKAEKLAYDKAQEIWGRYIENSFN